MFEVAARHHPQQPLIGIDDRIEPLTAAGPRRVADDCARLLERHRGGERDHVGAHHLPDEQDLQRID